MKKIFSVFALLSLLFASSCTKDSKKYDGPAIKHFPSTSATYFVEEGSSDPYMLPVGVTASSSSDVTMGVSVVGESSSAIEGTHFDFVVKDPVLKAGEVITNVEIKGNYAKLDGAETLTLMVDGDGSMQKEFWLTIQKFCPYFQDDFVGTSDYSDTWYFDELANWDVELVAGANENEIIAKNLYDSQGTATGDLLMILVYSDKSNFTVLVPKQEVINTADWGLEYGMLSIGGSGIFSSCDGKRTLDLEYTVAAGSFGPA